MKVLMIGAGRKVKGGITTVVNNYYKGWDDCYELTYIASMKEGSKLFKVWIFMLAFFKAVIETKRTDIVHIHMSSYKSFFRKRYFIRLAKFYKKKVIIHLHGSEFMTFYKESNSNIKAIISDTFNMTDHIIALSEGWKRDIATFSNTNCTVIYNAVKVPDKLWENKNNDICFLGRIGKRKGVFDLLEVVEKVNETYDDYKVLIGGDGEIDRLNQLVKEKKLTNVTYIGWIGEKEKIKLLRQCGYFALPSYNEGLPMSLLEAMSYGCVPFTSDAGGIPEVVKHRENGFIATAGDNETLYNNIIEAFGDIEASGKIRQNAHDTIKKEYSLEESLITLYKVYENVKKI